MRTKYEAANYIRASVRLPVVSCFVLGLRLGCSSNSGTPESSSSDSSMGPSFGFGKHFDLTLAFFGVGTGAAAGLLRVAGFF